MATIQEIIRPFAGDDVGPTPYAPPSGQDEKPALVMVGLKGGTKTFSGDFTYQQSTKIGAVHGEVAPGSSDFCCDSAAIQSVLKQILPGT